MTTRSIPIQNAMFSASLRPWRLPVAAMFLAVALTSCASDGIDRTRHRLVARTLKAAGHGKAATEERAAGYLLAAAKAAEILRTSPDDDVARDLYNRAASDLVLLLRDAPGDRMWNQPLIVAQDGRTFRLEFAKGGSDGLWDPEQFTGFTPAAGVTIQGLRNTRSGIGGTLVGVSKPDPLPPFSLPDGTNAPVTAVIDFSGDRAILSLVNPDKRDAFRLKGTVFPLSADFTAPLAHYRRESQLWHGLMGAIHVSNYMSSTGLYMLQPYDKEKIPLIFVHGLISTPQIWNKVVLDIENDPGLRGKYQYWVFRYPTGNPPGYSALRLREELAKVATLNSDAAGFVLVGHSMGGIVSRMQAVTVTRQSWDVIGSEKARRFFSIVVPGSVGDRATTYRANPKVKRLVFICTPHRGSKVVVGTLGDLFKRLIALPADVSGPLIGSAANAIAILSGAPNRLPNSVTGLSPNSPSLKVVNSVPIQAKYHTIIGDRGKGDSPDSSDGIVDYRSATVAGAASELIVPGDHGSQDHPETLAELRRILHLHLSGKDN